jgi:ubiquinone/menaquinone biosynthesis C-methylase UbiE
LPLENESCDVAIFSLSLMGINYLDYLGEAFRVLK